MWVRKVDPCSTRRGSKRNCKCGRRLAGRPKARFPTNYIPRWIFLALQLREQLKARLWVVRQKRWRLHWRVEEGRHLWVRDPLLQESSVYRQLQKRTDGRVSVLVLVHGRKVLLRRLLSKLEEWVWSLFPYSWRKKLYCCCFRNLGRRKTFTRRVRNEKRRFCRKGTVHFQK